MAQALGQFSGGMAQRQEAVAAALEQVGSAASAWGMAGACCRVNVQLSVPMGGPAGGWAGGGVAAAWDARVDLPLHGARCRRCQPWMRSCDSWSRRWHSWMPAPGRWRRSSARQQAAPRAQAAAAAPMHCSPACRPRCSSRWQACQVLAASGPAASGEGLRGRAVGQPGCQAALQGGTPCRRAALPARGPRAAIRTRVAAARTCHQSARQQGSRRAGSQLC